MVNIKKTLEFSLKHARISVLRECKKNFIMCARISVLRTFFGFLIKCSKNLSFWENIKKVLDFFITYAGIVILRKRKKIFWREKILKKI